MRMMLYSRAMRGSEWASEFDRKLLPASSPMRSAVLAASNIRALAPADAPAEAKISRTRIMATSAGRNLGFARTSRATSSSRLLKRLARASL